jgi:hypothetical protein
MCFVVVPYKFVDNNSSSEFIIAESKVSESLPLEREVFRTMSNPFDPSSLFKSTSGTQFCPKNEGKNITALCHQSVLMFDQ